MDSGEETQDTRLLDKGRVIQVLDDLNPLQSSQNESPPDSLSHSSPRDSDKETQNPYYNMNSPRDSYSQLSHNRSDEDMQTTPLSKSNDLNSLQSSQNENPSSSPMDSNDESQDINKNDSQEVYDNTSKDPTYVDSSDKDSDTVSANTSSASPATDNGNYTTTSENSNSDYVSGNSGRHLTRNEKENLTNLLEGNNKYNLTERLAAVNDNKELLNKFDREAVITANIGFKGIDAQKTTEAGKVEIRAEHNHLTDHIKNTQTLISEIQNGKINKNTVIAIERKQYGENLGMKDVIKIANILEYNEKNPNAPIKLPAELENTPIFQDALLYKIAKEKEIKVISLEGKNLEHLKDTPLYNENREQYMTGVINEIRSKGYNVIASVGSSHVINLEKNLNTNKHNNIGFNNIPRKLQEDTLKISKLVPKSIISQHLATHPKSSKSKVEALLESRKNNQNKAVKGI